MNYTTALAIAEKTKALLAPYCERIEIAGSIRRKASVVKDIEIVVIPKPYNTGLFQSGIATVVSSWPKVRGELPCKYTQRILPEGIHLDLFFAKKENWGLIYAIRTGSAAYCHQVLGKGWSRLGYNSNEGFLYHQGRPIAVPTEEDLYRIIKLPWERPENRNVEAR